MSNDKMKSVELVILAAGLGTRMKSDLPKVMHSICGMPMLEILVREMNQLNYHAESLFRIEQINIVIGHKKELVTGHFENLKSKNKINSKIGYSTQSEQKGTGHAVKCALNSDFGKNSNSDIVIVLNGDVPLFSLRSLMELLTAHLKSKSKATLGAMHLSDPAQYGRIIRKGVHFQKIVEFKDANSTQAKVREVNGGVYVFDRKTLENAIVELKNKNSQGEFYLTDVFEWAFKKKSKILSHVLTETLDLSGVNSMVELAQVQKALYGRVAKRHMLNGVKLHDPETTWISQSTQIGAGVEIFPFVRLDGESSVGDFSVIKSSVVIDSSAVGAHCSVGPMAYLRPGTVLNDHVKIGNFVEVKASVIGESTSASHLSYIGDAEVGSNVNIGCGFITCNYDGRVINGQRKHKTKIGNRVFIGSDTQVVAPIEIADGTFIASGSTVTKSVPEKDSLVFARSKQVTKPGYAKKYQKS